MRRPDRTDAHRERDALLQRFHDCGLVAVISTNGSNPEADIQVAFGDKPGEAVGAWLTSRGSAQLEGEAQAKGYHARLPKGPLVNLLTGEPY